MIWSESYITFDRSTTSCDDVAALPWRPQHLNTTCNSVLDLADRLLISDEINNSSVTEAVKANYVTPSIASEARKKFIRARSYSSVSDRGINAAGRSPPSILIIVALVAA